MTHRAGAPFGLIQAMDAAISSDTRMRPEHIAGTHEWLLQFIVENGVDPVPVTVDELHLICKAFGDILERLESRFFAGDPSDVHPSYRVSWSAADSEYVGLCTTFPSLSHLAPTAAEALAGIEALVAGVRADIAKEPS